MAASSSNAGCSRVKNTASVKDLKKCFRLHIKEDHLDVRSFREDEDVVIKKYEQLLLDILDQTLRPTEGVLRSAILDAYEISNKDATACARALHGCFKHCRSKLQSTTSGKRLDPATFRIVQRIKELQGPKASPASKTSSPRGSASSLAISPSPAKPKKLLFVESPTLRVKGKQSGSSADIFALYGLPKPAPNPADSTGAGSRCPRAAISVDDEEDLEVDSAESQGGTILGSSEEEAAAAAARSIPEQHPYFDAAQGCYVKLLAGGETVRGELLPGPEGMCLVKFPGEPEFQSQVPNLFLETNKDQPKSRLKRARGGADKGPAKKKQKKPQAAVELAEDVAEEAEEEAEVEAACEEEEEDGEESKAAEAPAAMPDPDAAESSEAPELPGGKSGEAIGAAAARTWNGYDISEIPESFLPPPEAKGKHSYTLRLDDEQICLDILIRNRAIWVKKPEGCKGQYSFRQYDSISSCFAECLKDCRKFLKDETTALLLE